MAGLIPFNGNKPRKRETGFDVLCNILDSFANDAFLPVGTIFGDSFKVDIREGKKEYTIEAELPGFQKDEIRVNLKDGILTIVAFHEDTVEERGDEYVHRERRLGSLQRSLYLADALQEGVSAKLEDGLLKITVPREEKQDDNDQIDIQ